MKTYYFSIAGAGGVQIDAWCIEADRMERGHDETGDEVYVLFRGGDEVAKVERKYVRAWVWWMRTWTRRANLRR